MRLQEAVMESDNVKQRVTSMRNDLQRRKESARERFSSLARRPHKNTPLPEFHPANPSRTKINEVLAALFHKSDLADPPAPVLAQDEATAVNDPA